MASSSIEGQAVHSSAIIAFFQGASSLGVKNALCSLFLFPLYKLPILTRHFFSCFDKDSSRSYCIISFFFPIFWAMDSAYWSSCGMHIDLLFRSVLTSHAKGIMELCLPVLQVDKQQAFQYFWDLYLALISLGSFVLGDCCLIFLFIILTFRSTSRLVSTFLTKALTSCFSPLSVLTYV